jgi:hypothetical protein
MSGDGIVKGGVRRIYFDQQSTVKLYANHQGGYKVFCPLCTINLAKEFSSAVSTWRAGGERAMVCPGCQGNLGLEEIITKPVSAFAKGAIVFAGAETLELTEAVRRDLDEILGDHRIICKRMG